MSHGAYQITRLLKYLPPNLEGLNILDAGCGLGEVGYYIRAFSGRFNIPIKGQPTLCGVDINKDSVDFIKQYLPNIYNEVYQMDLMYLQRSFKGRHFNVAMLNEVMEHIPKEKALRILSLVEDYADIILISTPYGDELNNCYPNTPEFNHVSTWYPMDFITHGYRVTVEDTIEFGNSLIAKLYKLARQLIGTPIQRKIIAVKKQSPIAKS